MGHTDRGCPARDTPRLGSWSTDIENAAQQQATNNVTEM